MAKTRHGILYFRYSPRPQDEDALRKQAEDTIAWCERNNVKPRRFFFDQHTSGAAPIKNRPGLRLALDELRAGELFVVRDLKRLARDTTIGLLIEAEIDLKRARLCVIEDGGIQPTKRENHMAWAFRVWSYMMGDFDRIQNQQRCIRRSREKQRLGRAAGGTAPYGYMFEDGGVDRRTGLPLVKIVRDPQEHPITREIVQLHLEGFTISEITDFIAAKHDGKARGAHGHWHRNTIKRLIDRYERGDFPDEVLA